MYFISVRKAQKMIGILLMTFPFLSFDFILISPSLRSLQTGLIILLSIFVIIRAIKQKLIVDKFFVLLILFLVSVAPFSLVEMNIEVLDILKFYGRRIGYFSLCLLIVMYLKKDAYLFTKTMTYLYTVIVSLNFITIVLFPEGLSSVVVNGVVNRFWLLGYDNGHAVYQIYAIMFSMLYTYMKKGRIISGIVIYIYVISLFSTISLWMATTIVSLLLIPITIIWGAKRINSKIFNMRAYEYIIAGICAVLLILTFFDSNNSFISWLTTDVLKKDITFNNRTGIWLMYFSHMKSFIYGNGYETELIQKSRYWINSAHNQWFQLFYYGGIIHIIAYLAMLHVFVKRVSYNYSGIPQRIISSCVFAFMIIQLMRTCHEDYWLTMYTIGAFSQYIVCQRKLNRAFTINRLYRNNHLSQLS